MMTGRKFLGLGYRWTTRFAEENGGIAITLEAETILPGLLGRLMDTETRDHGRRAPAGASTCRYQRG